MRLDERLYEWTADETLVFEKPCPRCKQTSKHEVRAYVRVGSFCEAVCTECNCQYRFQVIGSDFNAPVAYFGEDNRWHQSDTAAAKLGSANTPAAAGDAPACVSCGELRTSGSGAQELWDRPAGVMLLLCGDCVQRLKEEYRERVRNGEQSLTLRELELNMLQSCAAEQRARAVIRPAVCVHCAEAAATGNDLVYYAPWKASLIQCNSCRESIRRRLDYTGTATELKLIASYPEEQLRNAVLGF